ncbi:YidC/Oxa1 family membrane protein insertase [Nocardioides sp. BE266]|uniref:membrane protein insertase YidC n=1 Tax=Nocardioides sp. BE266 TaxID=2817725 RepID=UPI00285A3179|nr:membrane protein insertase YidC [Nocardioides sp. BE266]MDR7251561.1 YidC/Oxa1 family membrane protein insertase [Nocardioides sp. BE266]
MSPLAPVKHALAAVLASAHDALTSLGAAPGAAVTWLLCVAAVVVLVRTALLPFVIHGVRQAHAGARARPHMRELSERYKGKTDADSVRKMLEERRQLSEEHGVSRLGCLPLLLQLPVWIGLYHLLSEVASGEPVGAMGQDLVSSFGDATVFGVSLADHGYVGSGGAHLAVVAGLAAVAATLSFVTQHYFVAPNTTTEGMPETMVTVQRLMPGLSAAGILVSAGVVPVALLAYWTFSSAWTLCQSAIVMRWFPTPGTEAARRAELRA